jgi:diguanylate cyclase (GGDEF)-like protein
MDKSYFLSAIHPLLSVTLFVTFFFLWRRQTYQAHILNWALAYAAATLGSAVDLARIFVENALPLTFAANVLYSGVAFFLARGAIVRHFEQSLDRYILAISGSAVAVGTWFTFIDHSIAWRGTTLSIGGAALFIIAAIVIGRDKQLDTIGRLTLWTFILSALTLLVRPAASYIYEGPLKAEVEVPGSLWAISFKVFAMLSWFVCAILFLLRITADLMKELTAQSLTDSLTGIPNRRGFFGTAEAFFQQSESTVPSALIICDIDHFKRVNDLYGHRTGDLVIQGFAEVLRHASMETACMIGRLGGEEFVAVLPNTNAVGARVFAEGVRTLFASRVYDKIPPSHPITVSIGIADSIGNETLDSLMERADLALYKAKRRGRDRIEVAAINHPRPIYNRAG